jgi:hypothetical protein
MTAIHHSGVVTEILDQALKSESPPIARIHHPLFLDALVSTGLLVAVGGFTLCLLQLYVNHTAQQCLIKHDYKSTIALLSDPPLPLGISGSLGYDPKETLNEALYKDAMGKIELRRNVPVAVRELQRISPDSSFFYNAQRAINDQTTPSGTFLEGRTSVLAAPAPLSSSEKLDYMLQTAEEKAQQ